MSAQNSEAVAQQVTELLKKWSEAEGSSDVEGIDKFLDDDFVGIGPLGFTLTKEEWLHRHRCGDLSYDSFSIQDTSVRQYGDTAIVIGIQVASAKYQGNPVPGGNLRFTLITVPDGDRRVIAGFQMSPMGPPPGRPPAN